LVFGSINTDFITYVDRFPLPGETVTGGRFELFPGGKGANQAVAAARMGAKVEIFGCLGDDSIGRERKINLENAGISTQNVMVKKGIHSGVAQIIVDAKGENLIAVASGANYLFTPRDVILPQHFKDGTEVCLFQNEIPQTTTEVLIQECKRRGFLVIWNTAPACQQEPSRETLESVDFLICNRSELKALVGEGNDETLAVKLRGWGVENIIVTLGDKGSLLVSDKGAYYQVAFPVKVVDTVGAGDCFCGVFACYLSLDMPVRECLLRASAAAALSAGGSGAQTSMPDAIELEAFLSHYTSLS